MRIHKLILPTPFAIGPVNVYLIEDRQLALFDTGPETPEAMTALDEQLEGAGHGIKEIRRIVISHTHSDHCGLAPKIQQASGASVFVHPWEENRLTRPFDDAPTARLLAQAGVPVEEIERYRLRRSYYEGARAGLSDVRLLRDGDELPFSSGSLRVIHTPGHTPGHICLFHEGGRFLLGGDTVLDRITPNPVMNPDPRQPDRRFPSLRMYHQTLDRLQSIAPVLIHTGHGADVAELASYRTNLLRHHRQRQQRVV
ncbi:MAG: MBL fold metallo-hydrolase, partial [Acidobacteria bacterium]|nr:MBL fold metallo-hydrolase [Acidobacteriota bacterium]